MSVADSAELLDAFRAAALSVTKLYKTSTTYQARSRAEGYQDCLDDLLSFLDKENIGVSDGEGWRIRKWATDHLEPRDTVSTESDEEVEKVDTSSSSPQLHRSSSLAPLPTGRTDTQMRDSAPPSIIPAAAPATTHTQSTSPIVEDVDIVVPSQDTFTFQSSIPFPSHETYMNLANLDLSDSQAHSSPTSRQGATPATATGPPSIVRNARLRNGRSTSRTTINRVAGQKRKVNLAEIFDLGSLGHGNGKDVFGGGGKRTRHA